MTLHHKTLEKLRDLINEETEYRTGPKLVLFFSQLGFTDSYGPAFPPRRRYTDEKLAALNGTEALCDCLKLVFSAHYFVGRLDALDFHIQSFNKYLALDHWQIVRHHTGVEIQPLTPQMRSEAILDDQLSQFLSQEFDRISIEAFHFDSKIAAVLIQRLEEIKACLAQSLPLASIFLIGSTLEGVLVGVAYHRFQAFQESPSAPRNQQDNSRVRPLETWRLHDLITVAHQLGYLKEDVKTFSHALRDFRNYIHPYKQVQTRFEPNMHTAHICWQVLKAALFQLTYALSGKEAR